MIQRSTTCVIAASTNAKSLSALYSEEGPSTEDADILFHSLPNSVFKRLNIKVTAAENSMDAEILGSLEAKGFRLDKGPDDSGLWTKYLSRGGGYYIDTGCSSLIAQGHIAVKSGVSVSDFFTQGVVLSDGTSLRADIVVFATGYRNMSSRVRQVFGDRIAERVGNVWGFDGEGEIRGMWRPTGQPHLWVAGGNLALCRWFSRTLALQIAARVKGVWKFEEEFVGGGVNVENTVEKAVAE